MRTVFESGIFMMLAAVGGVVVAMQRRRGMRLIGLGMALVAVTSLLMPRSGPTSGGQLVAQAIGSLGGLACMFIGVKRLGPSRG